MRQLLIQLTGTSLKMGKHVSHNVIGQIKVINRDHSVKHGTNSENTRGCKKCQKLRLTL